MNIKEIQEKFGIVGESPAIKQILDQIIQVAPTSITVLLQGESGVGKDLVARAIHGLSPRKDRNLVIVNCGAIPEGIIESELFGHEKGAYTGAHQTREGYFEKADEGTIFLDEIAETPKSVQVKLLRILENGEFFRVGSSKVRETDVRVVAATNKDLWESVKEGDFREDLYYRLDTVKLKLPPLRERTDDIILLFRKFVEELSAKHDSVFKGFSDDARNLLVSYRWPGNIRELRNVAEQLVVLEKSQFITAEILKKYLKGRQHEGSADNLPAVRQAGYEGAAQDHTPGDSQDLQLIYRALMELRSDMRDLKNMLSGFFYGTFRHRESEQSRNILPLPKDTNQGQEAPPSVSHSDVREDIPLGVSSSSDVEMEQDELQELKDFFNREELPSLEDTEKFLINKALEKYKGNRRKASEVLGMSERTLYRKLDQYGLE